MLRTVDLAGTVDVLATGMQIASFNLQWNAMGELVKYVLEKITAAKT
jgi:hypothetical protein